MLIFFFFVSAFNPLATSVCIIQGRASWTGKCKSTSRHCKYLFWCCCSVIQPCLTLCDPMDCSTPGLLVHHQLQSLLKLMSIESVMPPSHLILCHPLLLLPAIFPSIRVFSSESFLYIRWPKYWSFSFRYLLSLLILIKKKEKKMSLKIMKTSPSFCRWEK